MTCISWQYFVQTQYLWKLYIERILPELWWSEAYKRTIWAVTDEQLRRYLRIDYGQLPEWIGYTWHLHFGSQVIYKRALEIQLLLHPIINIGQKNLCYQGHNISGSKSVIQDLHLQLHLWDHYSIIWQQICSCKPDTPFSSDPSFIPAFICARYCLLGLCYQNLLDIDQFRLLVLMVLTNDYKTIKELPVRNQFDQEGHQKGCHGVPMQKVPFDASHDSMNNSSYISKIISEKCEYWQAWSLPKQSAYQKPSSWHSESWHIDFKVGTTFKSWHIDF